uniref:DNA topoisomerase (ATP-hydrolyzing) n=1 Tax=Watanabea reniformis TaxID=191674 RepID=A0A0K0MXX4_9CHLO|nr:meiotic protein [Watanabea reniformis]
MSFGQECCEADDLWQESWAVSDARTQHAVGNGSQSFASLFVQEPPGEVLRRIEAIVSCLVESLAQGVLPEIEIPLRASGISSQRHLQAVGDEQNAVHYRNISLISRQGESAFRYTRIVKLLQVVHELVRSGRQAPQRDIYYQLKSPPLFASPSHVNVAIQDVVALLQVPRSGLGICCSSRGLVAGRLQLQEHEGGPWLDCHAATRAIPGDCAAIQRFRFQSDARFIVVLEKDAVFQRLAEERFSEATDSILVTAKGMPDLATRFFLKGLTSAFPHMHLTAVVDWNPSGVAILNTYKQSSCCMGVEVALPSISWLAMHAAMLAGLPESAFQPLTDRDRSLIRSLKSGVLRNQPEWLQEVEAMEEAHVKAEIEAAYRAQGFGAFARCLACCLIQEQWLQ